MISASRLTAPALTHQWCFFRAGGSDQVALERNADLLALDQIDLKLWVALACPVKGLEIDERTLRLMDRDGDGRIRVPEVIAAVKWTGSVLKNLDTIFGGGDLPLASIDEPSAEGKQIAASARGMTSSYAVNYPEPPTVLPRIIATFIGFAFVLSLLNHACHEADTKFMQGR